MPVSRTCQQCGAEYRAKPGERLKFCGAACYHRAKKENPDPAQVAALRAGALKRSEACAAANTKTCPNCGKVFTVANGSGWWERRKTFCSQLCQFDFADRKARALYEAGEPLATVTAEGVTCNICGKSMKCASTHFARHHGIALGKSLSRLERLAIYNLPKGTRLASRHLLELNREHGERVLPHDHMEPEAFQQAMREGHARVRHLFAQVAPSEKQIAQSERGRERLLAATYEKHIRACVTRTCPNCGLEFTGVRWQKRVYCPACRNGHAGGATAELDEVAAKRV